MNPLRFTILIVLTTLIMGIAFPIGRIGLEFAPPFLLMGIRYIVAGGVQALIVSRKPRPVGRQWLQAAIIGLLQSAGLMGCVYYSMRWITSGESAIITFTNPLLVIIIGTIVTGAKYSARVWAGVGLGILGVFVTFGSQMDIQPGTVICFIGAICFAAATLLIKRWGGAFHPEVLSAYQMLAGGIGLLLLSAASETPRFNITPVSIVVLLCLVVLCSITQFSLWFYLLQQGDPGTTSSFLFLAPLFAVLSSWLILGEQIEWYVAAGGVLICISVFVVNWRGRDNRRSQPAIRMASDSLEH